MIFDLNLNLNLKLIIIIINISLLAYLIGSLSFAVIVSKLMKLPSPHTYGSGNPGATNVLRSGNKIAAILTLILDAAKGWLAVYVASNYLSYFNNLNNYLNNLNNFNNFNNNNDLGKIIIACVALAVFLGHLFPIFHRFKGGKGVATAAGILLAIHPLLGLATLITWIGIAACFRYSSLAALVSAVCAALYTFIGYGFTPVTGAIFILSILLIWRHRTNIKKLLAGQESKIGHK